MINSYDVGCLGNNVKNDFWKQIVNQDQQQKNSKFDDLISGIIPPAYTPPTEEQAILKLIPTPSFLL